GSVSNPPQTLNSTGGWVPVTFDTKQSNGTLQPGLYSVHVRSSGANGGNLAVTNDIPFAVAGYYESTQNGVKPYPSGNPAYPDTYFYVPTGTTTFGINATWGSLGAP